MTIEIPEIFLWIFLGLAIVSCTLSAIEIYYRRQTKKAVDSITATRERLRNPEGGPL